MSDINYEILKDYKNSSFYKDIFIKQINGIIKKYTASNIIITSNIKSKQQNDQKKIIIENNLIPLSYLIYGYIYTKYYKFQLRKETSIMNNLNYEMYKFVFSHKNPIIKNVNIFFYNEFKKEVKTNENNTEKNAMIKTIINENNSINKCLTFMANLLKSGNNDKINIDICDIILEDIEDCTNYMANLSIYFKNINDKLKLIQNNYIDKTNLIIELNNKTSNYQTIFYLIYKLNNSDLLEIKNDYINAYNIYINAILPKINTININLLKIKDLTEYILYSNFNYKKLEEIQNKCTIIKNSYLESFDKFNQKIDFINNIKNNINDQDELYNKLPSSNENIIQFYNELLNYNNNINDFINKLFINLINDNKEYFEINNNIINFKVGINIFKNLNTINDTKPIIYNSLFVSIFLYILYIYQKSENKYVNVLYKKDINIFNLDIDYDKDIKSIISYYNTIYRQYKKKNKNNINKDYISKLDKIQKELNNYKKNFDLSSKLIVNKINNINYNKEKKLEEDKIENIKSKKNIYDEYVKQLTDNISNINRTFADNSNLLDAYKNIIPYIFSNTTNNINIIENLIKNYNFNNKTLINNNILTTLNIDTKTFNNASTGQINQNIITNDIIFITKLLNKLTTLKTNISSFITININEKKDLNKKIEDLNNNKIDIDNDILKNTNNLIILNKKLTDLNSDILLNNNELIRLKSDINTINLEIKKNEATLVDSAKQKLKKTKELTDLETEKKSLEQSITNKNFNTSTIKAAKTKIDRLDKIIKQLESEISSSNALLPGNSSKLSGPQLLAKQTDLKKKQNDMEGYEEDYRILLDNEIKSTIRSKKAVEINISNKKYEINEIDNIISSNTTIIKNLKDSLLTENNKIDDLKKILKSLEDQKKGITNDILLINNNQNDNNISLSKINIDISKYNNKLIDKTTELSNNEIKLNKINQNILNISDISKLSEIYKNLLQNINDSTNSVMQTIIQNNIDTLNGDNIKIEASKKILSNILSIPIYNKLKIIFDEYSKQTNRNNTVTLMFPYENNLKKIQKYYSDKLITSNKNILNSQKDINKIIINKQKLNDLQTLINKNISSYKNTIDTNINTLLNLSKTIIDNLITNTNKKQSSLNNLKKNRNNLQKNIDSDNLTLKEIEQINSKYTNDYLKDKYILLYEYMNSLTQTPPFTIPLPINNFKKNNSNNMIKLINDLYDLLDSNNKNLVNIYILGKDNIYEDSDIIIINNIISNYKNISSIPDLNDILIFNQIKLIETYYKTKLNSNNLSLKSKNNIISRSDLPNLETDNGLTEFNQTFLTCITEMTDTISIINKETEKLEYNNSKNKLYFLSTLDNKLNKYIVDIKDINISTNNNKIKKIQTIYENINKYFTELKTNNNNFISLLNQHNFLKDLNNIISKNDNDNSLKSFTDEFQKYNNELITKINNLLDKINKNKLKLIIYDILNFQRFNNIISNKYKKIVSIDTNKDGSNINKKGKFILILPYTDIMFKYLLYLLIIIDFLNFFYQ